jgi:hypothetical protein
MSRPYRPYCGTEGVDFENAVCAACAHYIHDERTGVDDCGLGILTASFVFPIDHPEYPTEWQQDERSAFCTAREEATDE